MPNRSTEIGRIMRAGETELARRRVRNALRKSEGNICGAARILNVEENTVDRWIFRLALEDDLAEARRLRREKRKKARGSRVHPGEHTRIADKTGRSAKSRGAT